MNTPKLPFKQALVALGAHQYKRLYDGLEYRVRKKLDALRHEYWYLETYLDLPESYVDKAIDYQIRRNELVRSDELRGYIIYKINLLITSDKLDGHKWFRESAIKTADVNEGRIVVFRKNDQDDGDIGLTPSNEDHTAGRNVDSDEEASLEIHSMDPQKAENDLVLGAIATLLAENDRSDARALFDYLTTHDALEATDKKWTPDMQQIQAHFGWSPSRCQRARRELFALQPIVQAASSMVLNGKAPEFLDALRQIYAKSRSTRGKMNRG